MRCLVSPKLDDILSPVYNILAFAVKMFKISLEIIRKLKWGKFNMMIKSIPTALTLVFIFTIQAFAGTGSEGYFTVYNNTDNNIVVGFYTNDGSGWSDNWIDGAQITPGEGGEVEFIADTGSCAQTFAVGWLSSDGGEVVDEPIDIDICDASNVYLDDNEIYYD